MWAYQHDCRGIISIDERQGYGRKIASLHEKRRCRILIVDLENKTIIQYSFSDERDIKSLNTFREDTIKSTVLKIWKYH